MGKVWVPPTRVVTKPRLEFTDAVDFLAASRMIKEEHIALNDVVWIQKLAKRAHTTELIK